MTQWHNNKPPKMDFPKFEGSDPRGWVIRSNQYFEFHLMDEIRKAKYASTYFEGRASRWYQFYHIGREWITWGDFTQDVIRRFTCSEHTNPQAEFNKLRQISTLDVYLDEFEELRAYVEAKQPGLTDEYFMSSFISGLKEDIKGAVIMATPSNFEEEIMLVKQADLNIQKARIKPTFANSKNFQNISQTTNSQPKTYIHSYTEQNPSLEKKARTCFNCDEKFTPGHVCKARLYHMYGEEDDSSEDYGGVISQTNNNEAEEVMDEDCHISLHALSGVATYKTIKLKGLVNKHTLTILVDSCATHNFIDPTTLRKLGWVEEYSTPLIVKVGDGNKLSSDSKCSKFKWITQGQTFEADLRVLMLGGCDMVLGVEWLRRYSPVTFDYDLTEVTLSDREKKIVLKGTTEEGSLSMISGEGFNRLLRKTKHGLVGYMLYMVSESSDEKVPSCIQRTIQQYKNVFDEPKGLPPVRRHDHKIPLKEGSQPISQRSYRIPYIQKSEIEKQVKEMLSSGIIQYSNSPFASPVLLVLKKDGTWRLCVDYRRLNDITIKDKFPIPIIEELLDELNGAKWFTKLDLRSGYHQIRVDEEDIPKTAFRTHHGHFEVMPFGLTNAPASFQSLMNEVFEPYLRKSVLVFFDDILVFSRSLEEHVKHLEEVLQVMMKHRLFAKMSKCSFAQRELEYLGHIISEKGVVADPKKIEKHGFEWSTEAETSFNQLKEAMINTPVLRLPDFTLPFTVETDACNVGVGAVLMQQGKPIAFLSKGLSKKNQMLSTYEEELLAVVMAINKWRPYLQGHHFIIKTDQQSLKYFLEQRVTSLLQQKWLPLAEGECNMITTTTPTWITEIGSSYEGDGAATEFLMLATDKENSGGWSLQQGLLKRDGKIFVGSAGGLRKQIITEIHGSSFGGHSGRDVTVKRVS
ncbi:C2H2 and C2HC zinc fingers superfamily protein, putative isoform 1 [Tanacetum coccineum]